MPSLKEVKTKITGVKKTSQITKAMNMVAASRLRGAQDKMESFRPYASKFSEAMSNLSGGGNTNAFPLMDVRDVKTVELIVVTSDRGLCGSFNANVVKLTEKKMAQYRAEGKKVSLICIGKKGYQLLRKSGAVRENYSDIMAHFSINNAREIASDVADNFLKGTADKVEIIYGAFKSVAVQAPVAEDLLPIQPVVSSEPAGEQTMSGDYIYEPSSEEIMDAMQPLYLNVLVYHAMLEVGASEHAARMTAMDNATTACRDIVSNLTIVYNKARQAAVTNELMDIVGGAEALK
ncbi:ATP synthase F1 subunit gamma [Desulfotalea psychrophila]|uniref:ATP synthase gamma chain n=1 Tax=Desulfotalea psychrophila (strain LSv54 / DSM 12343) TaxID=177439 RepID=ATPG_DESPS|nr:ATP synthase F1 subunit gamma [Desulfotalea psychrophila]Q6AQ11.1 RecName: Full=ATP synthase gamma chain; AltName: Full=ATP synthase F1 sector gamma subunit; AltName: Full=F-ATPase gamma subunit [Desulfotalea psychrophila LSv54]CAG35562.1 probable ATP synthase, gamma chain (AtpG) [Desulfotalea psychrophila LSv54]